MKIGNVAFLCIRLHGATTSVSMCVWGRGKGLSPACGMPPSSHAQKMLLSVQWSIFYATLQQTEPQMNHMHTHTHTQVEEHSYTHIHMHTNVHANRDIHRVAVRRQQWHWQWKLQQHVPIVNATSLLLLCRQQQWRNQLASTPRRGTPFKVCSSSCQQKNFQLAEKRLRRWGRTEQKHNKSNA